MSRWTLESKMTSVGIPLLLSLALSVFIVTFSLVAMAADTLVEVTDNAMHPDRLVLKVGDSITFVYKAPDKPGATVIIENSAFVRVSWYLRGNRSWEYQFNEAGSYKYFSKDDPSIRGTAIVFEAQGANADLSHESVSYSIGYDFGLRLLKNLKNLDLLLFYAGVDHAYNGVQPKLSADEMNFILSEYGRVIVRNEQQKHARIAKRNREEASRFLETNAQHDDVVVLPSGLQYKILKPGQGKRPELGSTVTVYYKATLLNGSEFDSTFATESVKFTFTKSMIPGFFEGLSMMPEGSRRRLFIPPELAYGSQGQAGNKAGVKTIEPNTMLIFEVELLTVK